MTSLASGQRLGPFELQRPLGRGGSGEVWQAVLHGPGGFRKHVALKLPRRGDAAQRAELLREARLGARLQHPNIVSTLLVGEHGGHLCIALELVRGRSLSALLKATGRLPGSAVLDLGEQAATALHHIHTFRYNGRPAGMVHRDVKPANLLIDPLGIVKLADLGISLGLEESAGVAGTHGYMPPEQLKAEAEPRSDLFALGATLYAAATGRRPFGKGAAASLAIADVDTLLAAPDWASPVDACVPGLGAVVRSCLRRDPGDRPPSARTVAQALSSLRSAAAGPTLRAVLATAAPELAPGAEPPSDGFSTPTAAVLRGNLRPIRDPFVGREEELERLRGRVRDGAWIVLLGPGGMGKTRLSVELARRMHLELPGGVWAFDLTEARTTVGICSAVAASLGVPLSPVDPVGQLGHALAARGRCLVLFDNLEQCVDALPETVDRWRALAPLACMIGTTRIRPGLSGEEVVPLGVLDPEDAIRLFETRVGQPLTEEDRSHVPALCEALERMPLPLELAAARVGMLAVHDILERLSLGLLASRRRDRPQRQHSVEASLQWSWELLSEPCRMALAQLSVFEGDFDLAAAEAVLSLGPRAPWALDVLQELVDASLVRVDPTSRRFAMWVVVREFAAELLGEDDRQAAHRRHGEHFARVDPERTGIDADLDNLVAACSRAAERGDAEVAVGALEGAGPVFDRRGPVDGWVSLAGRVCALPLPPELGCRARAQRVRALHWAGDAAEARAALSKGLAEARAVGDRRTEGRLLSLRAERMRGGTHESDVRAVFAEALSHHQAVGDLAAESRTLGRLGRVHREVQRLDDARACVDGARAIAEALGDRRLAALWETTLGSVEAQAGNFSTSRRHFEHAVEVLRAEGDLRTAAIAFGNLGSLLIMEGRMAEAQTHFEEALQVHRQIGDPWNESNVLANLAVARQVQGQMKGASTAIDRALELARAIGDRRNGCFLHLVAGSVRIAEDRLDDARHHLEECITVEQEVGDPRFHARARTALADIARRRGQEAEAREQADLARRAAEKLGMAGEAADARIGQARAALQSVPASPDDVADAQRAANAARGQLVCPSFGYTQACGVDAVLAGYAGDRDGVQSALTELAKQPYATVDPLALELTRWVEERLGTAD